MSKIWQRNKTRNNVIQNTFQFLTKGFARKNFPLCSLYSIRKVADIRKPTSSIPISSSSVCLHGTASWLAGLASCGLCSEAVEGLLITGDPVKSTSRGDSGVWSPVTSIITLSTSSGFSSLSSWLSSSTSTTIPKKQAFRSWNYISTLCFKIWLVKLSPPLSLYQTRVAGGSSRPLFSARFLSMPSHPSVPLTLFPRE